MAIHHTLHADRPPPRDWAAANDQANAVRPQPRRTWSPEPTLRVDAAFERGAPERLGLGEAIACAAGVVAAVALILGQHL